MARGGNPSRLGNWMHEFPQSSAEEGSVHYMDRLRLRSHIFTASFGALSRWDPEGTSTPGRAAFIGPFVTHLRDHTDIAPLVVQALKECLSTPSSDAEKLAVLLNNFMHAIRVSGAELDLRMAGLCMYHPDHPSSESSCRDDGHERDAPPTDAHRQFMDVLWRYSQRLDSVIEPYKGPWKATREMNLIYAITPSPKPADLGAFNLAILQWCQGKQPSRPARVCLMEYWRRLNVRRSGNSKASIEAAKARLAADNAAWRVYKWIFAGWPVRTWFEQNLDHDP
ncbi:hypothetical protein PG997_000237 [Apiospora hydei]|uniref:Uncharacterized protein n=1 Tax=Apiospora hydei TaxID=1337664 RepID=A0ABR1XA75_9PEZI